MIADNFSRVPQDLQTREGERWIAQNYLGVLRELRHSLDSGAPHAFSILPLSSPIRAHFPGANKIEKSEEHVDDSDCARVATQRSGRT